MSTKAIPLPAAQTPLASDLSALLAGLRWRIRAYIWVEGLALLVASTCAFFWIAFLIDYLPVLLGLNEMPLVVRLLILAGSVGVLCAIFYLWILARAFEPLSDRSMALLLERRHRDFHDSLLTSVELSQEPDHAADFSREMLDHTTAEARERAPTVNFNRVFNFTPLWINVGLAILGVLSLGTFAFANPEGFGTAVERLIAGSPKNWERSATIEVIGIEVTRPRAPVAAAATPEPGQPAGAAAPKPTGPRVQRLAFGPDRVLKVAKGSAVRLIVHADARRAVPDYCAMIYSSDQVTRAPVNMRKNGVVRDLDPEHRVQEYLYDGNPLKSLLTSLRFDVLGYGANQWPMSNRAQGYQLEVVDSPSLSEILVACEYPAYIGRLPDERALSAGMLIPAGTKVTLKVTASKPLRVAELVDDKGDAVGEIKVALDDSTQQGTKFSIPIGVLSDAVIRDIYLTDTDGVTSQKPQRVVLGVLPDETPRVEMTLKGIGSAVTPDVILRATGSIIDDYAVDRTWFEVELTEREIEGKKAPQTDPARAFPLPGVGGEKAAVELDLREEARKTENPFRLLPKDKVFVRVRAADKRTIDGKPDPNVGASEKYELEVVTGEELLRILEGRELGLRQRFERIVEEMNQSRDSLVRVRNELDGAGGDGGADPLDRVKPVDPAAPKPETPKPETPADPAAEKKPAGAEPDDEKVDPAVEKERIRALRALRVQRGGQAALRAAEEVRGVAVSFDDLAEELDNNRVSAEDRQGRYRNDIANPLKMISDVHLPELNRRLAALEGKLDDPASGPVLAAAVHQQADLVLLEMNKVLQKMLEYETYNELVDTLRKIIAGQDELMEATKLQQKRAALGLGEDGKDDEKKEEPKK